MIYFRENLEGAYLKNGFNIYKNDPNSKGFKFRLGKFSAMVRWSTLRKRWHFTAFWPWQKTATFQQIADAADSVLGWQVDSTFPVKQRDTKDNVK